MNGNLSFVSLKSFGDLIIQHSVLNRIASNQYPLTLLGEHLVNLHSALAPQLPVSVIHHGENGVPAAYDVKKHGMFKAANSILTLRRLMHSAVNAEGGSIVLDSKSWRESLIFGRHPSLPLLASSPNIYLAYEQMLESQGYEVRSDASPTCQPTERCVVFTGSRLKAKSIPPVIVTDVFSRLDRLNINVDGYVVDGEEVPDGLSSRFKVLPRDFFTIKETIRSADFVISADSMPAHLAAFYNIPLFVISPIKNQYWLPVAAYKKRSWCTFEEYISERTTLSTITSYMTFR